MVRTDCSQVRAVSGAGRGGEGGEAVCTGAEVICIPKMHKAANRQVEFPGTVEERRLRAGLFLFACVCACMCVYPRVFSGDGKKK